MKKPQYDSKDIANLTYKLVSAIRSLTFAPEAAIDRKYVLAFVAEYWSFERVKLDKIVDHLSSIFPNIAESTLVRHTLGAAVRIVQEIGRKPLDPEVLESTDPESMAEYRAVDTEYVPQCLEELTAEGDSQHHDLLTRTVQELLDYLSSLIGRYLVLVPLTGVQLEVESYELDGVKLVNLQMESGMDSDDSQDEPDTSQKICYVQIDSVGDKGFVEQRALRLAQSIAMTLSLHLGSCYHRTFGRIPIRANQHAMITTRVSDDLSLAEIDEMSNTEVARLAGHDSVQMTKVGITQLNRIKHLGFELIWNALTSEERVLTPIELRLNRAVKWYSKAVDFTEPDEQFVALAIALEVLLVGNGPIVNQLADRCGYLLGHDVHSTREFAASAKKLYGVRSAIVHNGAVPNSDQVDDMNDLVQRAIVDFAQRNFASWQSFEDWIERLHYSVNTWDIRRDYIPGELKQLVLERDKGMCRYCGNRELSLFIDHVVPPNLGGNTDLTNLVTACGHCATRKDGRSLEAAGMTLLQPSATSSQVT